MLVDFGLAEVSAKPACLPRPSTDVRPSAKGQTLLIAFAKRVRQADEKKLN